MSRFGDPYDYDYEEYYPNQGALWAANVDRALSGKRGQKALRELRDALLALPEKRLISGALCTVGGVERADVADSNDPHGYLRADMEEKLKEEGEGVCAIGAFLWHKQVKAGADPRAAFDALPTLIDYEGAEQTAAAGQRAGMTFVLAWSLAWRNDQTYDEMTPKERYEAFVKWIDDQLEEAA